MYWMASKVVSTKLTEEEYGKLVGLCSSTGFTVSKLLKRAILARMNEEKGHEAPTPKPEKAAKPKQYQEKKTQSVKPKTEEQFLYY